MLKKSGRLLVVSMIVALMLFTLTACGGGQSTGNDVDVIKIKLSHVVAETTPKGQAALKFKELVEEKSGGEMKVEVYPASQLYGDKEEMEALLANNIQFIAPSVTKLVGFESAFQLVDMPFLFKSDQAAYSYYDGPMGQKLMHSLEPKGIVGKAWWPNGSKHFTNSKRPLKTPADFKGLKFRSQSGGVIDAQFRALGAGSSAMAFSEVYQALQNGTVDGQENTFSNIDTQKYAEVQEYLTISSHGRLDYCLLTNITFWNGLTDEQRALLDECIEEATQYERQLADELNATGLENIKNSGKVKIYELTEADRAKFLKALKPVYDEYSDDIGQEYIDAAMKSE